MEKNKVTVTGKIQEGFVSDRKIHIIYKTRQMSPSGVKIYQAHATDWEFLWPGTSSDDGIIFSFVTHINEPMRKVFVEPILRFNKIR